MTFIVVIVSQLLFTTGDLLARHFMKQGGFHIANFLAWWFLVYILLRVCATFGQLYVLSQLEVGKSMALFSSSSLILVNVLSVLFLGEILSLQAYIGITFAVLAVVIIGLAR